MSKPVLQKTRLLRLAEFLRHEIPNGHGFDMCIWFRKGPSFHHEGCNTTACALGWAAQIPEFCAAGLNIEIEPHTGWREFAEYRIAYKPPKAKRRDFYLLAGRRFFGLTDDEARTIFLGDGEGVAGRELVAQRIECVVQCAEQKGRKVM